MYIWEDPEWPRMTWDGEKLALQLVHVAREQGRLLGKMESLGFELRSEAHLRTLTEDVVKSSAIEGEKLNNDAVRSSIARRLGMDINGLIPSDRNVDGIVEMMVDVVDNYSDALTKERLFEWHSALFPAGRDGMTRIIVGAWRDDRNGPMQVVSGAIGKEKVHYQAPPAENVPEEMEKFLNWIEVPKAPKVPKAPVEIDPLLKAGLAHLWFVTIHPFDDGNGRIARAIADLVLARADKSSQRFYSMSAQIRSERSVYYTTLERTQKGKLDITLWQEWFLDCLLRAIEGAELTLSAVLAKASFWRRFATESMNGRQIRILNMLFDDFEGKLTSSKWAKIAKCSQDTAHRDILDLISRGVLQKNTGGGRSTSYSLCGE